MFDIIAAYDHELTVPVEVIGVHNAKARLSGAAAAPQTSPEKRPDQKHEDEQNNQSCGQADQPEQDPVVSGQIGEELHKSTHFRCGRTQTPANVNTTGREVRLES